MAILRTTVLEAMPLTGHCTFAEFCTAWKEAPDESDHRAWYDVLIILARLERDALIQVERVGFRIDSMQLTALGADKLRAYQSNEVQDV